MLTLVNISGRPATTDIIFSFFLLVAPDSLAPLLLCGRRLHLAEREYRAPPPPAPPAIATQYL